MLGARPTHRPLEHITSRRNELVARFRRIATSTSLASGCILLDGLQLMLDARAAGVRLIAVAMLEPEADAAGARAALVEDLANDGVRVVSVPGDVMNAISPSRTPPGIVAIGERPSATLDQTVAAAAPLTIGLVAVQDPGNVGAVIRAAEAGGATGVVTSGGTADPFGWKALRGAMGSTFRLPVAHLADPRDLVRRLTQAGVRVLAASGSGGTRPVSIDLRGPTAFLLGNEGSGLDPELGRHCAGTVSIPMRAPVDSLNIAVAAGILIYEAHRQRSSA